SGPPPQDTRAPAGDPGRGAARFRDRAASGLADGLALDLDRDLLADEHAAGLQGDVPGQAEVLTVDLGLRGEAEDVGAERAAPRALELDVEVDRAGHILDRQLTGEHKRVPAVRLDAGAPVREGRVLLDVQEVAALQVRVPLSVAGGDAGGLDGRGDGRLE